MADPINAPGPSSSSPSSTSNTVNHPPTKKVSDPHLISPNPSTSGLTISLHPLALLSISDYITRHTLKHYTSQFTAADGQKPHDIPPIVGALLGTQEGRNIHLEHAYEVLALPPSASHEDEILLDEEWFDRKLQLFKETHPTCDLLGWFTTANNNNGADGPLCRPDKRCKGLHWKLLKYNESLILLVIDPRKSGGAKLPVGVWESVIEEEKAKKDEEDAGQLRFAELGYTIETGEAEMIGVDFVAKGGWGNAQAVGNATEAGEGACTTGAAGLVGKKEKEVGGGQNDELLSNLTAKRNAISMLHSRILLLKSYLEQLPVPHGVNSSLSSSPSASATGPPLFHPLLRSLKSLAHSRLPLITPDPNTSDYKLYQQESLAEQSDVSLVALLGTLTRSVEEMKEVQRKFAIVEQAMSSSKKGSVSAGVGGFDVHEGMAFSGFNEKESKEKGGSLGPSGGGGLGFQEIFGKLMRGVSGGGASDGTGAGTSGGMGAGGYAVRRRLGD